MLEKEIESYDLKDMQTLQYQKAIQRC